MEAPNLLLIKRMISNYGQSNIIIHTWPVMPPEIFLGHGLQDGEHAEALAMILEFHLAAEIPEAFPFCGRTPPLAESA